MDHPAYERMNAQLRGVFAARGWPQLLDDAQELAKCSERLASSGAYHFVHSFRRCAAMTDDTARLLGRSFPPTLIDVKLELVDSSATHEGGAALLDGIIRRVELPKLRSLDMNDCYLQCEIPAALGMCVALEVLAFAGNKMVGPIPCELGNCTMLKQLKVQNNQLEGALPEALGQCIKLEMARLNRNKLDGTLPATLGQCTKLTELRIQGNKFSGDLAALATCDALVDISCDEGLLADPLPDRLRIRVKDGQLYLNKPRSNEARGSVSEGAVITHDSSRSALVDPLFDEVSDILKAARAPVAKLRRWVVKPVETMGWFGSRAARGSG